MPVPFTATSDTSASCDAFSTKKIVGVQGPKAPLQTWRFFFVDYMRDRIEIVSSSSPTEIK